MKDKRGWKHEYKALYKEKQWRDYPLTCKDHPPPDPIMPSEKLSNGLTMLIIRFLTWKGHYANRISTQGQARIHKVPRYNIHSGKVETADQVSYTKSTTKRGTPDINAIVHGKAVTIEVKAGRDRISEDQEKQRKAIEAAGGIHYYARNMDSFYNWYYQTFENEQ